MTVAPARDAALDVLLEIHRREAFARYVLDDVLRRERLEDRDVALATRLAYGTLQYEGTLDEIIDQRLNPSVRLDPIVRDILRMATYELLLMSAPGRAVVHQAVETAKRRRPPAASLVNAVLRRISERAPQFPWGDADRDIDALARATGHPLWMAELLVEEHGLECASRLMRANNTTAPLYLRQNPFLATQDEAMRALESDGAEPSPCEPDGCILARHAAPAVRGQALASGLVVVADAAAQTAARCVPALPGTSVLDACAGVGTKSFLIQANAVEHGGALTLLASDAHASRVASLAERLASLSVPGIATAVADAADPEDLATATDGGPFDAVLVDAPCTGLGTLRRHPDKRWRVTPADVPRLAGLQLRMVHAAARLVRVGGAVVYSTCTVTHAENRGVAEEFLGSPAGRGFRTRDISPDVPQTLERWMTPEGWFASLPTEDGPDGHFVAAFERVN